MRQLLLYIFILFVCSVSAEQFMITGKVVDARDSLQCIGASVMVVGTNRGTATDGDGNFSIEVEKGEILKFSYVGYYSKEVKIMNDSSLVIELRDNGTCPEEIFYLIKGKVTDKYNEPLIGATVEIQGEGAHRFVYTNFDGNFSIEVEKGEILKFSYYGYNSKEVEVLNNSSLIIELEEDEELSGFDNCPVICLCERIRRDPGRYRFVPIERDSLKRAPKN